MTNDDACCKKCDGKCSSKSKNVCNPCGSSCAIYGLGVIGAVVYFVQTAPSFMAGVIGIGKAVFWPAILMYELLMYLQM